MKKIGELREETILKLIALVVSGVIISSSTLMPGAILSDHIIDEPENGINHDIYPARPCKMKSILTEEGEWVSFDEGLTDEGTSAEAFVTVSDTAGLTLVANFYGFWRKTVNSSTDFQLYDVIDMPGGSNIFQTGKPMMPMLIAHVEIPHNTNITLEMLHVESDTRDGFHVIPAQLPTVPIYNYTNTPTSFYFDDVYENDEFFPYRNASIIGGDSENPIILRGRRIMEVIFYPVQHDPNSGGIKAYSQMILKAHYDSPSQIEPVSASLRSPLFERLHETLLLNYDPFTEYYLETEIPSPGIGFVVTPTMFVTNPTDPNMGPSSPTNFNPSENGATTSKYLMITHPDFEDAVNRLAEWKTTKGVPTEVVVTSTNPTVEDIHLIVQEAYNTWQPEYALIVGDSDKIPCDYGMVHTARDYGSNGEPDNPNNPTDPNNDDILYHGEYGKIATDVIYFSVDGSDYLADIAHGRISVETIDEANTIVDKILSYEKTPPVMPVEWPSEWFLPFYDYMTACAFFEHDPENLGTESDKYPYVTTSESLRNILHDPDFDLYNVVRKYAVKTEEGEPITIPQYLANGDPVEVPIDEWLSANENTPNPEWAPDATWTSEARDNLLLQFFWGKFLMWHFDHGDSMNMWWPQLDDEGDQVEFPSYDGLFAPRLYAKDYDDNGILEGNEDDLYWLGLACNINDWSGGRANEDRLPFFISLDCNTGWFDGEIDQGQLFIPTGEKWKFENDLAPESFAERLTRIDGGGALAVVAPTRISFNEAAAPMLVGMMQAIWPELFGLSDEAGYELGYILMQGKNNVLSTWGLLENPLFPSGKTPDDLHYLTETTNQLYHLFGDPEIQLWTKTPANMEVYYPRVINSNTGSIVITVKDQQNLNDIEGARVCLQGSDLYMIGYTDDKGQVEFNFPLRTEDFEVTVTKHNYIPHNEIVEVIETTLTLQLSITEGKVGDAVTFTVTGFTGSNKIEVTFDGAWSAFIFPSAGVGSASGSVPSGDYGLVNVIALQEESGDVATAVFLRARDNPDPYIYSQWDESTWHLANYQRTYNNPCIVVNDLDGNFVPSHQLVIDTTYNILVTVYNDAVGVVDEATGTDVILKFANFGAGLSWTDIGVGSVDVPAGETRVATIEWTPDTLGHTCIRAEVSYLQDDNPNNNLGQENAEVISTHSPGELSFFVGNPINETGPKQLSIHVRQEGMHDDVWSAEIIGFSSGALEYGESEYITIRIDTPSHLAKSETRLFTVEVYIDEELVGGISISVTKLVFGPPWWLIVVGGGMGFTVLIIAMVLRKRMRLQNR